MRAHSALPESGPVSMVVTRYIPAYIEIWTINEEYPLFYSLMSDLRKYRIEKYHEKIMNIMWVKALYDLC